LGVTTNCTTYSIEGGRVPFSARCRVLSGPPSGAHKDRLSPVEAIRGNDLPTTCERGKSRLRCALGMGALRIAAARQLGAMPPSLSWPCRYLRRFLGMSGRAVQQQGASYRPLSESIVLRRGPTEGRSRIYEASCRSCGWKCKVCRLSGIGIRSGVNVEREFTQQATKSDSHCESNRKVFNWLEAPTSGSVHCTLAKISCTFLECAFR